MKSIEFVKHNAPRIGGIAALTIFLSCAEGAGAQENVCQQISESAYGLEAECVGSFDMRPDTENELSRVRLVEVRYTSPLDGEVMICPIFEEFGTQGTNGSMGIGLAADCRKAED